jgi:hypothetical protein
MSIYLVLNAYKVNISGVKCSESQYIFCNMLKQSRFFGYNAKQVNIFGLKFAKKG